MAEAAADVKKLVYFPRLMVAHQEFHLAGRHGLDVKVLRARIDDFRLRAGIANLDVGIEHAGRLDFHALAKLGELGRFI